MQFLIFQDVTFNPEAIDYFVAHSATTTAVTFRSGKTVEFGVTPEEFGIWLVEQMDSNL